MHRLAADYLDEGFQRRVGLRFDGTQITRRTQIDTIRLNAKARGHEEERRASPVVTGRDLSAKN